CQAEDGIRDDLVTGVQTCALPIWIGVAIRFIADVDDDVSLLAGEDALDALPIVHGLSQRIGGGVLAIAGGIVVFQHANQLVGLEIGRASCRERVWTESVAGW